MLPQLLCEPERSQSVALSHHRDACFLRTVSYVIYLLFNPRLYVAVVVAA